MEQTIVCSIGGRAIVNGGETLKLNNSFLGFTDGKSPMQKARMEITLDKKIRSGTEIIPKKEFIFKLLMEGCIPVCKEDVIRYSSRTGDTLAPKTEYRLSCTDEHSYYEINKTEYDFASYVIDNDLASEKAAESFVAAEKERVEYEQRIREAAEQEKLDLIEQEQKTKQNNKIWLETQSELYDDQEKILLQREIFLHIACSYHPRAKDLLVMIDNIHLTYCRDGLISRLWHGNKASRKTFECVTGIKLPHTDKATKELLSNITSQDYKGLVSFKPRKKASQKQLETFYILRSGCFEEVLAERLFKYGLDLFIRKVNNNYHISEARSGVLIATGKTKQAAIDDLKRIIERDTVEEIKKDIDEIIERNGVSPRFKQELSAKIPRSGDNLFFGDDENCNFVD